MHTHLHSAFWWEAGGEVCMHAARRAVGGRQAAHAPQRLTRPALLPCPAACQGFAILDADGGTGWDLLCNLIR